MTLYKIIFFYPSSVKCSKSCSINLLNRQTIQYFVLQNGKGQSLLIHAALHGSGYLLAKEIVSSLKHVSADIRKEVIYSLGANVDVMRSSNYGCVVLKGLEL